MADFGTELRRLRINAGLRQVDLVEQLGHVVARSTLAGVESGRDAPSERLWAAIQQHRPAWAEELQQPFQEARAGAPDELESPFANLAGPFTLLEARYVYTFREHRAPEEIIEVRRVRALKDGAHFYVLRMNTDGPSSDLDLEVLWGGHVVQGVVKHDQVSTTFVHRLVFEKTLRKGETYTFGLRSWITQEEDPPTWVRLRYTIPISEASLHLHFLGPQPRRVWRFGPIADAALATAGAASERDRLDLVDGSASGYFASPSLNAEYGLAWEW